MKQKQEGCERNRLVVQLENNGRNTCKRSVKNSLTPYVPLLGSWADFFSSCTGSKTTSSPRVSWKQCGGDIFLFCTSLSTRTHCLPLLSTDGTLTDKHRPPDQEGGSARSPQGSPEERGRTEKNRWDGDKLTLWIINSSKALTGYRGIYLGRYSAVFTISVLLIFLWQVADENRWNWKMCCFGSDAASSLTTTRLVTCQKLEPANWVI